MKSILILFFATALVLSGCEDKKENTASDYEILMQARDSLQVRHQEFQQTQSELRKQHLELSQQVQGMEVRDSTILENLARHEVILERHDAYMSSHEVLMATHKEFQAEFDQLGDVQIRAKIQEMMEGHSRMRKDHAAMEEDHDNMRDVFRSMRQMIEVAAQDDGEEEQ